MLPSTGMRFGRYELLARLGSGGMGEVFRARDHDLQRDVAIKFLPERFASDAVRLGRFAQEARAASQLNHPNIVTIHEIGQTAGLPYFVMELVHGQTLRVLMRGRRLGVRRTLEVAGQLADGLAKAHGAGIVHRDLKPENVMVSDDGFVKVLDFGLAKLLTDSGDREIWFDSDHPTWPEASPPPRTTAGAVLGTVGYMAPEQARGRSVDFRADQFAFGAILYEMATGKQAFHRETPAQTLSAIIEDPFEPLAVQNPGFPPPARWIVERCLEKDPDARYASTLDLARELRTVRDHVEEAPSSSVSGPPAAAPAAPSGPPSGTRRPWRRRVLIAAGALAALLLVPIGRGIVTWIRPALPDQKRLAVLPFASSGGGDEAHAFGDGLVETLTTKLTGLERFQGSLWVVPASEVRAAGVTSVESARRAFGANLVVTGSVQRTGDSVRLTANIVDAGNLRQLRAAVLDARRDDPAALQDGLVRQVADMLQLEVSREAGDALAAGATTVASAWELYVEGRGHLQGYDDPTRVDRAIGAFQGALQRDPGYALAYAGLGEAHWRRYGLTRDPASVDLALRACERAKELNDLLAPVHAALGVVHSGTGQPAAAVADFERALALDPASSEARRGLARAYEGLGRLDDAESAYRDAVSRQPDYWGNHSHIGAFYLRQGRYEEAERALRRVTELVPENARGHSNLGAALHMMGRDDEAVVELRRSLDIRPTGQAASNLATVEFARGRHAEAARAFEAALEVDDRDYRLWRNLAASYYWAPGERERAAGAYRRAAVLAEQAREVDPRSAEVLVHLADCHAMLGRAMPARRLARDALALAPDDLEVIQVAVGVFERVGDRSSALRWLRKALAAGYPIEQVESDPGLEALRRDPGYRSVVQAN